jgi:ABC-type dipeptide/oligopeptide/nickel transport system permease component
MVRYLLRRLTLMLPLLFLVTVVTFVLVRLIPGNPAELYAGGFADPQLLRTLNHQLGLDKPLPIQYLDYLNSLVHGQLGVSSYTGHPVASDLSTRFPPTLELTTLALIVALVIAVPLGILAGARQRTTTDRTIRGFAILAMATPDFWLGLVLIQLFYVEWRIFPAPLGQFPATVNGPRPITGIALIDSLLEGQLGSFRLAVISLVLPTLALAIVWSAPVLRQMRGSIAETLVADYVRTARATGISSFGLMWHHVLRNASLPVLTQTTLVYTYLLGGDVLVEVVFNWPGLGQYTVQAIQHSDYNAIQGVVLLLTLVVAVCYLLVDIAYSVIDPRTRV